MDHYEHEKLYGKVGGRDPFTSRCVYLYAVLLVPYMVAYLPVLTIAFSDIVANTPEFRTTIVCMLPVYALVVWAACTVVYDRVLTKEYAALFHRISAWMSLSQLAIAFVSYVINPNAMILYVFVHFVSCMIVYDKEFKMRWSAYLAEHANPHCHFHANCLCKCTGCATLRCACPVGSAACAETRHPGDEYYGVNLDSHERKAYENIMGVRTVDKIVAVVAVPSIVIVALPANLLVATGAVEFNIVYRAVYMFMFLVIQTVLFQGLVLLDSNVREKITRCNAVNIIAMIAIYVVATILVG